MCARRLGIGAVALALVGGSVSCLPADTRPAPGSILLTVASGDEPVTMTADGWAITVDRLILGIGDLRLDFGTSCNRYTEGGYVRLLDGLVRHDQKVGITYGLGQCYFSFQMIWPSSDTLLGEGVSESDRERMRGGRVAGTPGQYQQGLALDFAATATRGMATKRIHWLFRSPTPYVRCFRKLPDAPPQRIELRSDEHLTFRIAVRGVTLFGDGADPDTATLRFDPIAAADAVHGNADDEITLAELGAMSMDAVRQYGPYVVPATMTGGPHSVPRSLEDYMYRVLLRGVAGFGEDVSCDNNFAF
jgi:hypothetical protein